MGLGMAKYEKVVEYCQKLFSKNQIIYQKVWHFCERLITAM